MAKERILVVEDENIVALDLRNQLTRLGYTVPAMASSGEDAIRKAAEMHPDLVLMDIKLRGKMDGVEAAQQIEDQLRIPVIYLTAFADEATLRRAKITSPFGYVIKPFEERNLAATIEMALSRHEMERKLRESEDRYRQLVEHAPAGIYEVDLTNGRFVSVNDVMCEYTGYTREEFLSLSPFALLTKASQEQFSERLAKILAGETVPDSVEYKVIGKDRQFWVLLNTRFSYRDGQPTRAMVVVHDITERRRAEQLLQALNQASQAMEQALTPSQIFAAVAEELKKLGFACMILLTNEDQSKLFPGYLTFDMPVLRAAEKLAGFRHEDFGFSIKDVDVYRTVVWKRTPVVIEGDEAMRQVLPGPVKRVAGQLVRMLGMSTSIAAPLVVEGKVMGVLSVHSADLMESDVPTVTAFAHQVAAAWRKAQLIQDLADSLEELQQTQAQLIQAQRMEALGRLAGGVAHDFNNLLTIIQVNTQLLAQQLHPADPLQGRVQQIREAGERAARLTRQLLRFSRHEVAEPRLVDIGQIATELNRMLQRIIGEDIELVTTLASGLWPVEMNPSQMEQVIVNLVVNARDAMPRGGRVSIETANIDLDEATARQVGDAEPGEYVVLAISDTGIGMDDQVKAHLFEPFFTTKKQGQGTGLGLSTVYGIVKQNRGQIWFDSHVGQGTTFKIYLPRAGRAKAPHEAPAPTASPGPARGSETILLVEDEAVVRELAAQILRGYGYRVLEAMTGPEALQIAREHGSSIHLLLADVVMPQMSGRELGDQLQLYYPGMRCLYMSGYGGSVAAHHGISEEGAAFLPKPFSAEVLTRKVRAVLDEPKEPTDRTAP
jgi:two-component system cell cycle sensor histidine kinase/response regulator CckA